MYSLILHGKGLQKWRELRILLNPFLTFSNSFSSASVVADVSPEEDGSRKGHNFTVSYLVDSLGLTWKLAESISTKVSFEEKSNPDSVLNLLRIHGFTDSHISSVVTEYPRLLIANAELTEIVFTVPKILARTRDKTISRHYDFVKEIKVADKSSKLENSSAGEQNEEFIGS